MSFRDDIIREYVQRYNSSQGAGEEIYLSSVMARKKLNLHDVSEEDVERVVQPFLYKWGRMGRALGKSKFPNWLMRSQAKHPYSRYTRQLSSPMRT
jgi:hypothetical protein